MKITAISKIKNESFQYDIQTDTENFFANRILVHNSMVTPVLMGNKNHFKFKTKKSFETKEAALADSIVFYDNEMTAWVKKILLSGMTPTFEITSPKFPIVLLYEKDELTLLHIRENVTGRYLSEDEMIALNSPFPIVQNLMDQFCWIMGGDGLPTTKEVDWERLKHYAETATGVEGVVIQFGQEMVKLKTKWYCDLHHSVTFTRWRDIARTVLADQADDLKGAFAMTGRDIEPILKVERIIKGVISAAQTAVEAHVSNGLGLGRTTKEMALAFKDHAMFGQVMRAFRGQEVNWYEWYEKNLLNEWTLEVV